MLNLLEEMEPSTVKLETHDQDVQNCVKHEIEGVGASDDFCIALYEIINLLSPEIK